MMMYIREIGGEWYRARSPETLARRLYGKDAAVHLEHQDAHDPSYRTWTVTNGKGRVLGRLYAARDDHE